MPFQYLAGFSGQKQVETQYTAGNGSSYGDAYEYDNQPGDESGEFEGKLVTIAEFEAIQAAFRTKNGTVTLNCHGTEWTGKILAYNLKRILGFDYYEGTVTLKNPVEV